MDPGAPASLSPVVRFKNQGVFLGSCAFSITKDEGLGTGGAPAYILVRTLLSVVQNYCSLL